jgi:hypothetical protein
VVGWWPPGKDEYRIYAELLKLHLRGRRQTSSSVIWGMQPRERRNAEEKCTTSSQGIVWKDVLL